MLAEFGYSPVSHDLGCVIYQHETIVGQVFALDWSSGDMSVEHFLFVLEHNGENPGAIAAFLESR